MICIPLFKSCLNAQKVQLSMCCHSHHRLNWYKLIHRGLHYTGALSACPIETYHTGYGIRHHHSITWWGHQLTKTLQNGGPYAISEILHIEYWIVCCIKTYLIHIYHMSKCNKCNWNRYIEGFCMWNEHFHINALSPNITYVILMSWPLMTIYFLLLNYWLLSVKFSYHI